MLTYDDFISGLETIKGWLNPESAGCLNELGDRIYELARLTGTDISEVTEALRRVCTNTGLSLDECLEVLNGAIQMEGENQEMAINVPYKDIGNYHNIRVIEVSMNDYITMLLANELEDILYVITETLSVIRKDWIIGTITKNKRSITELKKHVNARVAYGAEINKRVQRTPTNEKRLIDGVSSTLITARPTVAYYIEESKKKMRMERERGYKLIDELTRGHHDNG